MMISHQLALSFLGIIKNYVVLHKNIVICEIQDQNRSRTDAYVSLRDSTSCRYLFNLLIIRLIS